MKKINNLKQLRVEKRRLQRKEKEQEHRINKAWHHLKATLRSELFPNQRPRALGSVIGNTILQSTFSVGTNMVANMLARKAGDKIMSFFTRNKQ